MTTEQQQVKDWMKAFGQETPEKPTIPSLEVRKLRAKLILEEALETIVKGLGIQEIFCDELGEGLDLEQCLKTLTSYKHEYFSNKLEPSLLEIADSCEDLKVVTEGTLVACGLANYVYYSNPVENTKHILCIDPLFNEVMRSNWSKMWTLMEREKHWQEGNQQLTFSGSDGQYFAKDSDGKVIKSPSYSPANLQPIIEEMSK